ncbi:hypothetical protein OsJ_36593 [Oryza sativa Japonica Group]|uniref:Uncharacterized protein n=1 Tax=Oryza sativa subsp. japonica TaxID=39947 RepID=A3CIM8_ORYSJ|nr:hypothetical protein OsJ_36593 [Oryza sativa Japonica Group]
MQPPPMRERQRWRPEEDAILLAYVRQYGPREWSLVSQRMNRPLHRDAKSCLERWKNYLRPGIKKGSLTDDEQRLVIRLQAKHGNKWKKIAAEVPGRTAKRLGQVVGGVQGEAAAGGSRDRGSPANSGAAGRRPGRLRRRAIRLGPREFADKVVNDHQRRMMAAPILPPWMSSSPSSSSLPSVTLSLASAAVAPATAAPPPTWGGGGGGEGDGGRAEGVGGAQEGGGVEDEEGGDAAGDGEGVPAAGGDGGVRGEDEGAEGGAGSCGGAGGGGVPGEDGGLRRDAEAKEQKMAEQWAAKHARLAKFLDQVAACRRWPPVEINGGGGGGPGGGR